MADNADSTVDAMHGTIGAIISLFRDMQGLQAESRWISSFNGELLTDLVAARHTISEMSHELNRQKLRLDDEVDYRRKMDKVLDDEHVRESCINPHEDLVRSIRALKLTISTTERRAKFLQQKMDLRDREWQAEIDRLNAKLSEP